MASFKSIKGQNGWTQLAILFGLLIGGFILVGVLQLFFIQSMGVSLLNLGDKTKIESVMFNPANAQKLQWMQFLSTALLLFLPAYLFIRICYGKEFFWAGSNKYFSIKQILLALGIMWVINAYAQPLGTCTDSILLHFPKLNQYAKSLEDEYNMGVSAISHLSGVGSFILALFMVAILPALFEEFFFRGVLQTLLIKWWKKPILGIVVTSLIFSFIHMSVSLFFARFALGYVLGLMFYFSKNIWINIFAHFINNSLALAFMFFGKKSASQLAQADMQLPVWTIFLSLLILAILFFYFNKVSKNKLPLINLEENKLLQNKLSQWP